MPRNTTYTLSGAELSETAINAVSTANKSIGAVAKFRDSVTVPGFGRLAFGFVPEKGVTEICPWPIIVEYLAGLSAVAIQKAAEAAAEEAAQVAAEAAEKAAQVAAEVAEARLVAAVKAAEEAANGKKPVGAGK